MTDEKAIDIARIYGGGYNLPVVHIPYYSSVGKEIITVQFLSK